MPVPTCEVCHLFFVLPQTFETLFNPQRRCLLCETYATVELQRETIPLDENVMEFYTFDAEEHPMFTRRAFESLCVADDAFVFYETAWRPHQDAFALLSALMSPFRLFHYRRCIDDLIALLEQSR